MSKSKKNHKKNHKSGHSQSEQKIQNEHKDSQNNYSQNNSNSQSVPNPESKENKSLGAKNETKKDFGNKAKIAEKTGLNWSDPIIINRILAILVGLLAIGSTVAVSSYVIPEVIWQQTDEAKALKQKQENEQKSKESEEKRKQQIAEENQKLKFTDQKVEMKIKDFGSLKIDLKDKAAPKTVENFLRLTNRGYFDGLTFHRMVEGKDFAVIQGGDPTGSGSGGETASGQPLVDELWQVKPEYENNQEGGMITNEPKFSDENLYKEFRKDVGVVSYDKGLILMAKTSAPDSATSQFFITLEKTILPAQYTVFGVVEKDSLPVLEKISKDVDPNPQRGSMDDYKDGPPNKELKIEKVSIVS